MVATMDPVAVVSGGPKLDFDCDRIVCQSREEWLQARRNSIGASDTAGIFGVGYTGQSAPVVWDSKVNQRGESDHDTARLMRGRLMEPSLRSIFGLETGLECYSPGEFTIFRSREHSFLGATLDGVTVHDEYGTCPVELKAVGNFQKKEWEDEPPLKFQIQCQHQLAVTGASHAYLLGFLGVDEPVVKVVERNDRFIAAMLQRLADFWGYVERRELPPVDESEATGRLLSMIWPQDSGATVVLPEEAKQWAEDLEQAKAAIKAAEAIKTAAENKIKAAIGEGSYAEIPGMDGRYSWKTQTNRYPAKEAHEVSFRVLRRCK